jgi:hypothetical protein
MNPAPSNTAALARSHPALAYRDVVTSGVARGTDGNAFQLWGPTPPSSGSVHQQRTASSASRQRGTPNRRRARQTQPSTSTAVGATTPLAFVVAFWPFVVRILVFFICAAKAYLPSQSN